MSVFFSTYEPEDYDRYGRGLAEDDVPMDLNNSETIGLRPDWKAHPDRSHYFMFNLHSLRFAYSLIEPAERGDIEALVNAVDLFLYWDESNPTGSIGWQDEHSVSWRSVTLAYFWEVWCSSPMSGNPEADTWKRMAVDHGRYMSIQSNYLAHHNHGLNNALGLVALGCAFRGHHPQARDWLDLGFERGEQQMQNNVSAGGIHLEQSGFYHCYTLRSFLEIQRAAIETGWKMSSAYSSKLDRMLGMAARIGGRTAVSHCFPYSDLRKDPLREFPLRGEDSIPPGLEGPGVEQFREVLRTQAISDFAVDEQGGFTIVGARDDTELSLVFHTRILSAPHAHQDALGVYACLGNRELLLFPSTMFVAERSRVWRRHFIGPQSHNTVQVDSLSQWPINGHPPSLLERVADDSRARRLAERIGLTRAFDRFCSVVKPHLGTLCERSNAFAGEVLESGQSGQCEYVTACHRCYTDIIHTRTVARIGGRWLVVRDRIAGTSKHTYRQTWHFPPQAQVLLDESRGIVTLENGPTSGFAQLVPGIKTALCTGTPPPDPGGWYATGPGDPVPTPAIRYEAHGTHAEFLWVLQAGDAEFECKLEGGDSRGAQRKVRLDGATGQYNVLIDDAAVYTEYTAY